MITSPNGIGKDKSKTFHAKKKKEYQSNTFPGRNVLPGFLFEENAHINIENTPDIC